jgi:hypothetical protein
MSAAGTDLRTFLIADIRGYTKYTGEHGDEAAAALASSFADLVQEAVEARGGTLIELRGDEALVGFASARQALRAAVDLQARIVEANLRREQIPAKSDDGRSGRVKGSVRSSSRSGVIEPARPIVHMCPAVAQPGRRFAGHTSS